MKTMKGAAWTRQNAEQRIDDVLASAAFRTRLHEFFQEWLGYGPLVDLSSLPTKMTAGFSRKDLPSEAFEDLKSLVNATVFTSRGTMSDLLLSNDLFYNGPNLALVYGVPAPAMKGPVAMPIKLDSNKYLGLLSRASMNLQGESQKMLDTSKRREPLPGILRGI